MFSSLLKDYYGSHYSQSTARDKEKKKKTVATKKGTRKHILRQNITF